MDKESRVYYSMKNASWAMISQGVIILLSFFSKAAFVRMLGNEYNGINGLFSNILNLLSLAELGIGTSMIYTYYKPIAEGNTKKIAALANYYRKIYMVIIVAVLALGMATLPFLDWFVKLDKPIDGLRLYFVLYLLNTASSYLFVYRTDIIAAYQRRYVLTIITFVCKTIRIGLQIAVLVLFKSFLLYLLLEVAFNFIANIVSNVAAGRMYPYIKDKEQLSSDDKKELFVNLKSTAIYKLSIVLTNSTDNILISKIIGTIWAGLYSNYYMITVALINVLTVINNSICASVGNLIAKKDEKKNNDIMNVLTYLFIWVAVFTTVCLAVLFDDFITLWLGKDNVLNTIILASILVNHYSYFAVNAVSVFRESGGLFKETKYVTLIAAIINIVLSIILGKLIGLAGILFATFISRLTARYWYEAYMVYKKILKKSMKGYAIKQLLALLLTIVLIIITKSVTACIPGVSWFMLIIKGIVCVIIPNAVFILLTFKTKEFRYLFDKLIGLTKKNKAASL